MGEGLSEFRDSWTKYLRPRRRVSHRASNHIAEIIDAFDLVVFDNFGARILTADHCQRLGL